MRDFSINAYARMYGIAAIPFVEKNPTPVRIFVWQIRKFAQEGLILAASLLGRCRPLSVRWGAERIQGAKHGI